MSPAAPLVTGIRRGRDRFQAPAIGSSYGSQRGCVVKPAAGGTESITSVQTRQRTGPSLRLPLRFPTSKTTTELLFLHERTAPP